jgi:hypothetical protein
MGIQETGNDISGIHLCGKQWQVKRFIPFSTSTDHLYQGLALVRIMTLSIQTKTLTTNNINLIERDGMDVLGEDLCISFIALNLFTNLLITCMIGMPFTTSIMLLVLTCLCSKRGESGGSGTRLPSLLEQGKTPSLDKVLRYGI